MGQQLEDATGRRQEGVMGLQQAVVVDTQEPLAAVEAHALLVVLGRRQVGAQKRWVGTWTPSIAARRRPSAIHLDWATPVPTMRALSSSEPDS